MVNLINGPSDFEGPTRPVDLIRHGSTHLNSEKGGDRIRGWVDVPLDDRGIKEAEAAGRNLALLKAKPRVLFTSDLQRALQTAHIISKTANIPLVGQPVHGLRPWNLGHFQGMESSAIAPQMKMFLNNPGQRVPGGESFNEFSTRFISTLKGLMAKTQFRMGLVSHHRNERLLASMEKANWRGFDKTEFAKHGSPTGILITFEIPNNVPSQGIQGRGQLPPRQR